jgi:hypothetical protein
MLPDPRMIDFPAQLSMIATDQPGEQEQKSGDPQVASTKRFVLVSRGRSGNV